jgi:hypothetical protein
MWKWIGVALIVIPCAVLCGCGGTTDGGSVTTVFAKHLGSAPGDAGRVVDAGQVPVALARTGLKLEFRPGPTPARFAHAIYGSAANKRGAKIDFGLFISAHANAAGTSLLRRLVPGASLEGSVTAESFVLVTTAGRGHPSKRAREEEFSMMGKIQEHIAKLAPTAWREEGP